MSKKLKSEARKKRASQKRAIKASNQLRWSEYAGTESNRKKRTNRRKKSGVSTKHTHPNGACGNVGCLKCSDVARLAHVGMLFKTSGTKYAERAATRYGVVLH